MNNNYTDERMNLNEVCNWLAIKSYRDASKAIYDAFVDHPFTIDGMIRKDVIQDVFSPFEDEKLFRQMECDVITYMNIVPLHEAHID